MTAATATMRKLLLVLNSALKRDPTYLELKTVTDRRQPRNLAEIIFGFRLIGLR